MKKLFFLLCALSTGFLPGADTPNYAPLPNGKAPFRLINSNDTTHIFTSASPYRETARMPFTSKMLEQSVKEMAVENMGAQMIQAGTGWTAWWKSEKFPLKKNLEWFKEFTGKDPYVGIIADYFFNQDGDIVRDFLAACRKYNQACFVSYRLNDVHHTREAWDGKMGATRAVYLSEFYVTHPEYRLGQGLALAHLPQNWLIPEVRQHKFELIDELVRSYDIDGFELDFLRFPIFFPNEKEAPMRRRVEIMTEFIARVRDALDESAKDGRKRWLCVRVPAEKQDWIKVGFDPKVWRAAGVDIFNLSPSSIISEQTDVALVRELVPEATVYVELGSYAHRWKIMIGDKRSDNWRRASKEMLENAARTAYGRGADGITLFNFVYYRSFYSIKDEHSGPSIQPPFHYLSALASPETLTAPPYYYYAPDDRMPQWEYRFTEKDAKPYVFFMDTYRPPQAPLAFRMQVLGEAEQKFYETQPPDRIDRGQWEVSINGQKLERIANLESWGVYPFAVEFPGGLGYPEQYLAWLVPKGLLKDGKNEVSVRLVKGDPMWFRWSEIFNPDDIKK